MIPLSSRKRKNGSDDKNCTESPHIRRKIGTGFQTEDCTSNLSPSSLGTSDLLSLLDFSAISTSKDIADRFDTIAETILHGFMLRVHDAHSSAEEGKTVVVDFEVLELECYLYMPEIHEDPFTHGSEEQKWSGRWYFHRAPRRTPTPSSTAGTSVTSRVPTAAGGYRGGTRKGLDLTLGGPATTVTSHYFPAPKAHTKELARGGVLLRTIRRVSDGKVVSGPSLLVDEILRLSDASNIADLVNMKWDGNINAVSSPPITAGPTLRLYPVGHLEMQQDKPTVYQSPRIGLDLSHSSIPLPILPSYAATLIHPRVSFISCSYRYFVHPHLLTVNGRGHTFFGVYRTLVDAEDRLSDENVANELVRLMGLKLPTVTKYLEEYRTSLKKGDLAAFIGAKGKGAGSTPVPFLRMMATLERLRLQANPALSQ